MLFLGKMTQTPALLADPLPRLMSNAPPGTPPVEEGRSLGVVVPRFAGAAG